MFFCGLFFEHWKHIMWRENTCRVLLETPWFCGGVHVFPKTSACAQRRSPRQNHGADSLVMPPKRSVLSPILIGHRCLFQIYHWGNLPWLNLHVCEVKELICRSQLHSMTSGEVPNWRQLKAYSAMLATKWDLPGVSVLSFTSFPQNPRETHEKRQRISRPDSSVRGFITRTQKLTGGECPVWSPWSPVAWFLLHFSQIAMPCAPFPFWFPTKNWRN